MRDDEQFTQDALSRLTPIEPSAELRRMVAELPIQHPRSRHSRWSLPNVWMPTLSLAAVALLGIFVGRGLSNMESSEATATLAKSEPGRVSNDSNQANGDLDEEQSETELEELLILATAGDFSPDDWDLSQNPEASEVQEGTF